MLTQTVWNLLVAPAHHQQDAWFWSYSSAYTYPPFACHGNNDLHIPASPHSECGTRETHASTESPNYTDTTQIVSNLYRKKMTVIGKNTNRKDTKSLHRRWKSPSRLRSPPARHTVLATLTYVYIRPPACQGNNDLHIPAGSRSEYATTETHTSSESH